MKPVLLLVLVAGTILHAANARAENLDLIVLDAESRQPVACRVHLAGPDGKPVQPPGLPFWRDHFVCDGKIKLTLPFGAYTYTIERGPEYASLNGRFTLSKDRPVALTHELKRIANLAREGWWSGETHVHRPVRDVELLMRAEDLYIAGVHTWWNNASQWRTSPPPAETIVRFDGNRFYDFMAGEDERGGGALLYFGLGRPLPIAGSQREFPAAIKFLRDARALGAKNLRVDIEKPFWWDTPIWLASGLADSVGIANNHLHRGGMLDNEAWGKPRDREKYPPAWGNGLWTQDIYFHILNSGLRLPPSAGSASGVLPNPVGYNRAYVHIDGELTYEKWWNGLKAGRVFVSNGPLLRLRVDGQFPGHVFKATGPLHLKLEGQLDSRDPIHTLELIRNGRIERIGLPGQVVIEESGWFLVRAIANLTNTFRFASTGPWYVEVESKPAPPHRESVQFFLNWIEERKEQINANVPNANQSAEILDAVHEAEHFWQEKLGQAQ